jgi:hypothetical protein
MPETDWDKRMSEIDWDNWIQRQERFYLCDDDTPERHQLMPGPVVPIDDQTHSTLPGGHYRDGSATGMDS